MKRARLNITVDAQILEFAKQWSYVSGKSLSRLFDEYFDNISYFIRKEGMCAYEFRNNPYLNPDMRRNTDAKERMLQIRKEALDIKERELSKNSPDKEQLKFANDLLNMLKKQEDDGLYSKSDLAEGFEQRWSEIFGDY